MSQKKSDFSFKSSNGINTIRGIKLYCDDVKPKAVLQIAHGMVEHYGRYVNFAEFMAQNGYIVYINDHLGHKHSVENDDQLGYTSPKNGHLFVLKDLHAVTEIAKSENPGLPIFLLGHSMGSFYARYYASVYKNELSGLIISGTGNSVERAKAGLVLCNVLTKLGAEKKRSNYVKNIAFGSYLSKIENPKTENDWISRDEKIVERYVSDKYCQFNFTIGGYRDLMNINILSGKEDTYKNTPNNLPIYIFSGSMDPVGNYGIGVMQVFENYKKYGKTDVSIKIYDGARHEPLNEINRQEAYNNVLNWLNSKI